MALVVPFDGTESFSTPANVGRLVNLTQRKYAYMRPGSGFHGSLANVDVSGDPSIDHINIDKSPRLHARAINEVLAVLKGRRIATPSGPTPAASATREESGGTVAPGSDFAKPEGGRAPPLKSSNGARESARRERLTSAYPERRDAPKGCPPGRTARLSTVDVRTPAKSGHKID